MSRTILLLTGLLCCGVASASTITIGTEELSSGEPLCVS